MKESRSVIILIHDFEYLRRRHRQQLRSVSPLLPVPSIIIDSSNRCCQQAQKGGREVVGIEMQGHIEKNNRRNT